MCWGAKRLPLPLNFLRFSWHRKVILSIRFHRWHCTSTWWMDYCVWLTTLTSLYYILYFSVKCCSPKWSSSQLNQNFVPNTVFSAKNGDYIWTDPQQVEVVGFLEASGSPAARRSWLITLLNWCYEISTKTLPGKSPPCSWCSYPSVKFTML